MKVEQQHLDIIIDHLKNFKEVKPTTTEVWIILFNGKQISLSNGKKQWAKKAWAKSALANKMKYNFQSTLYNKDNEEKVDFRDSKQLYNQVIDELEKYNILEFRKML